MVRTFFDSGVLIAAARSLDPDGERALKFLEDPNRVFLTSPFIHLEVVPKAIFYKKRLERFDDEFEPVIGGNIGSALELSHGADKRQFFGETKRAAIQAGRLKAGPRLAKDQRPYRCVGPEASEPA